MLRLLGVMVALAVMIVPSALSAGASDEPAVSAAQAGSDNITSKQAEKQLGLRQTGLEMKLNGTIPADTKIGKVAKGQYVELAREGEDSIWTVLAEFGTRQATSADHPGHPNHGGTAGPVHNQIPQPNRAVDNTTIWTQDFSQPYYQKLLFDEGAGVNSMREFYIEQSAGRYAVNGAVTDWVQVPFNEAAYGSNYCGSIVCTRDIRRLLVDELNAWYNGQLAAGKSAADIDAYLARFDKWDRYDYDHDGNFAEPDGYIDHFQSIHAGEGEETGGGAQGTDAIWSHRSYSNTSNIGSEGPSFNKFGGVRVGTSNLWVGDYTIEPENGGVGVFSHEFGHDLGLPDEYDTSGNTGGAENSTGFWTIMSSGSYGNDGTQDIGSKPIGFNAWDKFQLGWLNYEVARAGEKSEHKIGPAGYNTKQAQGVFVVLPKSLNATSLALGTPPTGANAWYSTNGNSLDVSMTHDVTLPAGPSIALNMKAWYEIETCWDYAYLRVSTDGGATYTNVHTSVSDAGNENSQNFGEGITGISGAPKACDVASGSPAWVPVSADLSAYAGKTIKLQFRYWTDGAAVGRGFEFDDLAITAGATTVFADGAESGDNGWTLNGFRRTTGVDRTENAHYYLAENRQYTGYDAGLRTGPYNFGHLDNPLLQDWAERFPYQDGLVVWYWNTAYSDNNVGDHPGKGQILPVDARPTQLLYSDGSLMRPRIQAFDTTFGLSPTDAITVYRNSAPTTVPSQPAVPVFNDLQSYWTSTHPADGRWKAGWSSVAVPQSGTQIRVKSETPGGFTQIEVSPSK